MTFSPSRDIDALMTAARWPGAAPRVLLLLLGRLAAARRFADGYTFFSELARHQPDNALALAAAGRFQSSLEGQVPEALAKLDAAAAMTPGLPNFLRGTVLAQAPAAGRAKDAIADLELVVALPDRFPPGLRRTAYHALAGLYTAAGRPEDAERARAKAGFAPGVPAVTADYWVTEQDGFRFVPPRLVELAPGVHVAQGYDFSDFSFVRTGAGIVAIDTGSTGSNAAAALDALRQVTADPITHIILTHSHWDHIGGLDALRGPDTVVIAQANFARELAATNGIGIPWPRFRPAGAATHHDVTPDQVIGETTALRIGDLDFVLTPVHGGETDDALLIHLPQRGVVFAGDMLMPHLGAPFVAEGSAEGLFDAMRQVEAMAPEVLIHGHPPLTENFPAAVFPGLRAALESLYDTVHADLRANRPLAEILRRNHLPDLLRDHPYAVLPYLVVRDNLVKRVHRQQTGYWQPDGEGIEDIAPDDWALALDLLADGDETRHTTVVRQLLDADQLALALRLTELALREHPGSEALAALRRENLDRLIERHQAMSPFKFIVYSGLSGLELPRPEFQ